MYLNIAGLGAGYLSSVGELSEGVSVFNRGTASGVVGRHFVNPQRFRAPNLSPVAMRQRQSWILRQMRQFVRGEVLKACSRVIVQRAITDANALIDEL